MDAATPALLKSAPVGLVTTKLPEPATNARKETSPPYAISPWLAPEACPSNRPPSNIVTSGVSGNV